MKRHASSLTDIYTSSNSSNSNLFAKTNDHDALRSMLRTFVRREVRKGERERKKNDQSLLISFAVDTLQIREFTYSNLFIVATAS